MDAGVTRFYQIYYHEVQKENMWPFAIPYFNNGLTIFFENTPISEIVSRETADKIAVCSWKLKDKLHYNPCPPRRFTDITLERLESEYDVMPLTCNTQHHETIAAGAGWHPNFRETMTKIVEGIGKNMPFEVKPAIYQNAFSAKREIYRDYVSDYLNPAMELVKNDPEIYKMATVDSNYTKLMRDDCATPQYLQEKIGFNYYPLIPFILERLFSVYVHNKRINVTFL